jgi:hypothetical protein
MDIKDVNSNSQPTPVPAKAGSCGLGEGKPPTPNSRSQNLTLGQAIEIRSGLEKVVGMKSENSLHQGFATWLSNSLNAKSLKSLYNPAQQAGLGTAGR